MLSLLLYLAYGLSLFFLALLLHTFAFGVENICFFLFFGF